MSTRARGSGLDAYRTAALYAAAVGSSPWSAVAAAATAGHAGPAGHREACSCGGEASRQRYSCAAAGRRHREVDLFHDVEHGVDLEPCRVGVPPGLGRPAQLLPCRIISVDAPPYGVEAITPCVPTLAEDSHAHHWCDALACQRSQHADGSHRGQQQFPHRITRAAVHRSPAAASWHPGWPHIAGSRIWLGTPDDPAVTNPHTSPERHGQTVARHLCVAQSAPSPTLPDSSARTCRLGDLNADKGGHGDGGWGSNGDGEQISRESHREGRHCYFVFDPGLFGHNRHSRDADAKSESLTAEEPNSQDRQAATATEPCYTEKHENCHVWD